MEEAAISIGTHLLLAGIVGATAWSQRELQTTFRQRTFSTEIDAVGTEFHSTLQDVISEVDQRSETNELTGVAQQWKAIIEHLAERVPNEEEATARESERVFFEDEEDAVDQISHALAGGELKMGSRYGSDTSSGGYQDRAPSGEARDRAQQTVLGSLATVVADDHDLKLGGGGTATLHEEPESTDASSRASATITAVLSQLVDDPESMSSE